MKDLSDIIKVAEHISENSTNLYLDVGWRLIYVGQLNDTETQRTAFVVGWPKGQGEPIEPDTSRWKQL